MRGDMGAPLLPVLLPLSMATVRPRGLVTDYVPVILLTHPVIEQRTDGWDRECQVVCSPAITGPGIAPVLSETA